MINKKKYIPIIKTGEAELRALKFTTAEIKDFILPLFELTKGRKKPKSEEGSIENNLLFIEKHFKNYPFIIDLTTDDKLSNSEIEKFLTSENGYKNWVDFCISIKPKYREFYPSVVIVEEQDYNSYYSKLYSQIKILTDNFKYIVFRAQNESIAKNLILDINNIIKQGNIKNFTNKIIFILDYRYINDAQKGVDTSAKICKVLNRIGIKNIVISSTSFPKTVSEYMSASDYVKFKLKEIEFFQNIKKLINNNDINIIYSDYATVNPVRNDNVVFARGWIPRIDVPSFDNHIHCLRARRLKKQSYADVYQSIASSVVNKDYFTSLVEKNINCWGVQEITNASIGNVGGSSPRYWISVRMNIYLNLLQNIINTIYQL